jgi:hypothetical protein
MTYFTGGEKGALCERFDLIDGVGLHAQIRCCIGEASELEQGGEIKALEPREA